MCFRNVSRSHLIALTTAAAVMLEVPNSTTQQLSATNALVTGRTMH
jgi:hypothetical protein